MNENKFRAWDKEGACWIPQGQIAITGKGEIFSIDQQAGWLEETIEISICRYIGLKDKNGKEIYEGDIINLINADGESINVICEFGTARRIIFENTVDITGFYFRLTNGRKTFPIVSNYAGKHDLELFEVIGNIYENPELLEKEGK